MLAAIFGGIQAWNYRYWQTIEVLQYKASFSDLEWYWNVVLGVLMVGTNSMIKLYYFRAIIICNDPIHVFQLPYFRLYPYMVFMLEKIHIQLSTFFIIWRIKIYKRIIKILGRIV